MVFADTVNEQRGVLCIVCGRRTPLCQKQPSSGGNRDLTHTDLSGVPTWSGTVHFDRPRRAGNSLQAVG